MLLNYINWTRECFYCNQLLTICNFRKKKKNSFTTCKLVTYLGTTMFQAQESGNVYDCPVCVNYVDNIKYKYGKVKDIQNL